ncbi:phosphatase PAP2 family protein [Desulfoprunum benzoelyticum]|uniref:Undecaprenyl-diphosphatase n=1 Tax=Desulfoprunum benzoelyticum TaxID=1506996 RepID=A0A840URF4_9BACT|nr:phosphatase PAP2 family protein [Desulfoprunum benzoelyticum]MBB5347406.1 undecaprenyl-diphosphatase [Desulfoprunum benzoelyticum]MBM9530919.1 phosphatase PAP2 family protein [Desulfoprunum benzoelyticum]
MDSFFTAVTWLGSLYVLLPSTALLTLLLLMAGRSSDAALLGISLPVTTIAVHLIKLAVRRPRPEAPGLPISMPPDWSFPSAHTAQATAFFMVLALIAIRRLPPRLSLPTALCGMLIVAGVGYSRIYLQVHYPTDVIGGLVVAIIIVMLVQKSLLHLPLHTRNKDPRQG